MKKDLKKAEVELIKKISQGHLKTAQKFNLFDQKVDTPKVEVPKAEAQNSPDADSYRLTT